MVVCCTADYLMDLMDLVDRVLDGFAMLVSFGSHEYSDLYLTCISCTYVAQKHCMYETAYDFLLTCTCAVAGESGCQSWHAYLSLAQVRTTHEVQCSAAASAIGLRACFKSFHLAVATLLASACSCLPGGATQGEVRPQTTGFGYAYLCIDPSSLTQTFIGSWYLPGYPIIMHCYCYYLLLTLGTSLMLHKYYYHILGILKHTRLI